MTYARNSRSRKRRAAATVHSSNVLARRMSMARRSKHNHTSECATMLTKCSQARRIAAAVDGSTATNTLASFLIMLDGVRASFYFVYTLQLGLYIEARHSFAAANTGDYLGCVCGLSRRLVPPLPRHLETNVSIRRDGRSKRIESAYFMLLPTARPNLPNTPFSFLHAIYVSPAWGAMQSSAGALLPSSI